METTLWHLRNWLQSRHLGIRATQEIDFNKANQTCGISLARASALCRSKHYGDDAIKKLIACGFLNANGVYIESDNEMFKTAKAEYEQSFKTDIITGKPKGKYGR